MKKQQIFIKMKYLRDQILKFRDKIIKFEERKKIFRRRKYETYSRTKRKSTFKNK